MEYWYKRFKITFYILFVVLISEPILVSGQGRFIPNQGQWKHDIVSKAEIKSGAIFLCKNQVRYNFSDSRDLELLHPDPYIKSYTVHYQSFFLDWLNANPDVNISSKNEYPEYYNYFIGNDTSQWRSGVHAYSSVAYKNLYQGINLTLDASGDMLEYTYEIAPGVDVSMLKIKVEGAEGVYVNNEDLIINSPLVSITEKSPYAYQVIGDAKVSVPCRFKVSNGNIVSFSFPAGYDKSKPLIIDPVVIFATYSGSKADNFGFTGTFDNLGYGYSGGDVFGTGFPVTPGAFQTKFDSGTDAYTYYIDIQVLGFSARDVALLKYTPDGKNLVYATYLGGKNGNEQPHSMVVDNDNNLVILGTTASSDFPVTKGAYSTRFGGETDIFVTKLSPDGKKLLASTFVGGNGFDGLNGLDTFHLSKNGYIIPDATTKLCYNYGDQFRGEVVTDNFNSVYVASSTMSSNFPVTKGCYQSAFGGGTQDGVVFKLDSTFNKLVWSTFIGGTKDDGAYSLQLDSNRNVFVCGGTLSPYFFPKGKSYQPYLAGDVDGFICHIKNDGSSIINATYLGTVKYDQNYFVQLDKYQYVYVYGQTASTGFPIINVKYSVPNSGNFITKFNYSLDSIVYSTVFGSGKKMPDISPTAFLVDKCQKVYISGWGGKLYYPTLSKLRCVLNMPITSNAYQKVTVDSSDFYVSVFEKNIDTVLYASYFGGPKSEEHVDGGTSRFDKNGIMYQSVCGGCGGHSDFPTTPGAWSRTNNSDNCNNLLFKVDLNLNSISAGFIAPKFGCKNNPVKFINTSVKAISYEWFFGDSTTSTADTPTHFYVNPGVYTVMLVAYNPNSCEIRDTFKSVVSLYKSADAAFSIIKDSCGLAVKCIRSGYSLTSSWDFGDGTRSNTFTGQHTYKTPGTYTIKLLVDSGTVCADSLTIKMSIKGLKTDFTFNFEACKPQIISFQNLSVGSIESRTWYFPFASTDTALNPVFNFTPSGTYEVSLVERDSFGCKDSVTKTVIATDRPKAKFSLNVDSCNRQVVFTNHSVGAKNVKWIFDNGDSTNKDTVVRVYSKDTSYRITLIASPGLPCADTTVKIISFSHPKAQFTYALDTCSGVVQFIDASKNAYHYNWQFTATNFDTTKNPVFTFIKKGQYPVKLVIKSAIGCIDSVKTVINMPRDVHHDLFIPNVFTPNKDPYNNTYEIQGLSSCYNYVLDIYNRWGQLMYHGTGTDLVWDGYYNGKLVAEGDYYYVFKGTKEGELRGTITVLY
jgi:gliding motility-associated-like protein